jgi:uncharacterized surface protein with fasciclin (FAS1) repeats
LPALTRGGENVDGINYLFDEVNPRVRLERYGGVVDFSTEVVHPMYRSSKITLAALMAVALTFSAATVLAQKDPEVGGAAMFPTKNIVENAVNSKDHTTLVAAVKAAGLVETLEGAGPFTVFAPTNEAFAKLPAGTVDTLLKPENKDQLVKILTYHVVAGKVSSKELVKLIKSGGGKAMLKTVAGETLTASLQGGKVVLTDEKGGTATVTIADVYQSNGIIHVVDAVLLPN